VKLFLLVLCGAAFAVVSLFIWRTGEVVKQTVAVAGVLFSGVCLVFGVVKLIWRQPALIINSAGILDNSSALGKYAVLWDEIEDGYISTMQTSLFSKQRVLSIRLKRTEEFIHRQPAIRACLMKANVGLLGAPVNISTNTLPVSLEELISLIQQKYPKAEVPTST
jgi:hypothetical protein